MAEMMVESDMLHPKDPRLYRVMGLKDLVAEATSVSFWGPNVDLVPGDKVTQAMLEPVSFIGKIFETVEKVEGTLKRVPCWRWHLQDPVVTGLKYPLFQSLLP